MHIEKLEQKGDKGNTIVVLDKIKETFLKDSLKFNNILVTTDKDLITLLILKKRSLIS